MNITQYWDWFIKGKQPPERHAAMVEASWEFLGAMMCKGNEFHHLRISDGIPEGAQVVAAQVNIRNQTVELLFEHPDLPVAHEGEQVPNTVVRIEKFEHAPDGDVSELMSPEAGPTT